MSATGHSSHWAAPLSGRLGQRATVVLFSSAFCAACRATRRLLADVTPRLPGVVSVEIDAEGHLGLVRAAGVRRTPTVVVLDARGLERTRLERMPTRAQLYASLAVSVPSGEWDGHPPAETPYPGLARVATVDVMRTTWLTRRRAVDNCRVHSALCLRQLA
jgi:hypothetical protein